MEIEMTMDEVVIHELREELELAEIVTGPLRKSSRGDD